MQLQLIKHLLAVLNNTIKLRKVFGYNSPEFRLAMLKFSKVLADCDRLPEGYVRLIKDFKLVHEALARDNMHMLKYLVTVLRTTYLA